MDKHTILKAIEQIRSEGTWVPDEAIEMAGKLDYSAFPMMSDRAIALMLIVGGAATSRLRSSVEDQQGS